MIFVVLLVIFLAQLACSSQETGVEMYYAEKGAEKFGKDLFEETIEHGGKALDYAEGTADTYLSMRQCVRKYHDEAYCEELLR